MPNGKEIKHLNKYETNFLYKEIFVDKIYLKNNIEISSDSVIFDVGANIGMFAVFIECNFPGANLFLFEPSPQLCKLINENVRDFTGQVNVLECGVSDKKGRETLTYYPGYSILSSFKANEKEDQALLKASVENQLKISNPNITADKQKFLDFLSKGKLENSVDYECEMVSLSEIIEKYDVQKIDLLKIDAEKCEAEIINGIIDDDWEKIKQVVIEVHDFSTDTRSFIENKLIDKGFQIVVEQESNFEQTGIYNMYGKKLLEQSSDPNLSIDNLL